LLWLYETLPGLRDEWAAAKRAKEDIILYSEPCQRR
jgi:hypothetical protein